MLELGESFGRLQIGIKAGGNSISQGVTLLNRLQVLRAELTAHD